MDVSIPFGFLVCKLRDSFASATMNATSKKRRLLTSDDDQVDERDTEEYFPLVYSHTLLQLTPTEILNFQFTVNEINPIKENVNNASSTTTTNHSKYKMLFVPTRHHHSETHVASTNRGEAEHYSHDIYSMGTTDLAGSFEWSGESHFESSHFKNFEFAPLTTFNRLQIKGTFKNMDLLLVLDHELPVGLYSGPDGCFFESNHNQLQFINYGSIYITPKYKEFYLSTNTLKRKVIMDQEPFVIFHLMVVTSQFGMTSV